MKLKTIFTIITGAVAIAVVSCNKSKYGDTPQPAVATTSLNVVNAGTDTLKLYVNGTILNTTSYIYPGGNLGYVTVPDSTQSYNFKKIAYNNVYNAAYLFSTPLKLTLSDSVRHTLFVSGETTDKCFVVNDTTASASSGALIRFVHASASLPAVDVFVGDSVSIKNRSFKSVSSYMPVSAGTKKLTINMAGTSTSLISNVTLTISSGANYTVYLKGKANSTGAAAVGYGLLTY
jgi:hypothetical protein